MIINLKDILRRKSKDSTGNAIIYFVKYMYKYSEGRRKWLYFYVFLFILVNFVDQIDRLLIGKIFNTLQDNGVNNDNIKFILLLISFIFVSDVIAWALHGPARVIEQRLAQYLSANYRKFLYTNVLNMPLVLLNVEHSGKIISKINKGVSSLDRFSAGGFLIIRVIFQLIAIIVTLVIFDYKYAIWAVVLILLIYIIIGMFEKSINVLRDKINGHDNTISEILFDTISNITTIKMLSLAKVVSNSMDKEVEQKYKSFKRKTLLNELKWYTPSLISTLFITGVLATYVYDMYLLGTSVMIGTLYILYGYLASLKSMMYEFAYMLGDIQEQYRDIVNSESLSNKFNQIKNNKAKQINNIQSIELSNLHFKYSEAFDLSIDHLKLEKGKSYAFVGESGCGKTTTMKILASLVECEGYEFRIFPSPNLTLAASNMLPEGARMPDEGGADVVSTLDNIRDSVMLIPQEPELFSNSIRENITLGLPYGEGEVNDVLDMVNMRETVEGLPDGIESKVYEKGVNLSGGQKQRLALARGILFARDKEIILLDEPTSSVDQDNEERIYRSLLELAKDKILVSSVHKRNLLNMFDHIVYFEKGKIVRVE